MKKIFTNLSLYFSFLHASLKETLIYRIDCIVAVLSELVVQAVSLIFMFIVFQTTTNIGGWSFEQILFLYGLTRLSVAISTFCFDGLYELGPKYMKNGEFDKFLLRPVHPLISVFGSTKDFMALGDFILGLVIVVIILNILSIPITAVLIFQIIFFSIIGALIFGAIKTIFSVTSFWTYRSNEIIWSFYRVYTLTEYPLNIYNIGIKVILSIILPYAFISYIPSLSYLGINSYLIYISPLIAIVLWIIAIKIWNLGLNKYRSTGN